MSEAPDLLTAARVAVAASSTAPTDELAAYYVAVARTALGKVKEDLRLTAMLVLAREQELARRGAPKEQLEMAAKDSGEPAA